MNVQQSSIQLAALLAVCALLGCEGATPAGTESYTPDFPPAPRQGDVSDSSGDVGVEGLDVGDLDVGDLDVGDPQDAEALEDAASWGTERRRKKKQ